jgi:DNA-binding XRE family transcriptional regulator
MILNHLLNMKMKAEELYELPIGASLTQKELAAHLGVDCRTVGRSEDSQITLCISYCDSSSPSPLLSRSFGLAYVNLHKVPMTGTSIAESLIMRNLTSFLWLGIARLMGKNTPKSDKTISYQTLCLRLIFLSAEQRSSIPAR